MDSTAETAQKIVRSPTSESSAKRYKGDIERYHKLLIDSGADLDNIDFSGTRRMESDPVVLACALILQRCGPKSKGYEGLKATSTGGAIKSAVVHFWRNRGINGEFIQLANGGYMGNPGKSPDLQTLIRRLDESQRIGRTNLTQRAYQETHEDVRALYYKFVQPQLSRAIRRDPTVNYSDLQASVANILQFSSVARGSEILSLEIRDLLFTGDNLDSPVVGVLPITKNRKRAYTYLKFSKGIDLSICSLSALLAWLCVLRAHGVADGKLFLQVTLNVLQGGTAFDGATYGRLLRSMGEKCGIHGLAEHSARRGGAGYHYFVLRHDLFFLHRTFNWESMSEMMKYIGIGDVHNSYALLGFTAFGTNELSHSFLPAAQ